MTQVSPRLIAITVDDEDRSEEVSKAVISSGASDSDFLSFASARGAGKRDYVLNMTLAQDHAAGTLHSLMWTAPGSEVTGIYAPYGNEAASVAQPHFSFTAIVSEPDGDFLGGEATDSTSAVATNDVAWKLTGRPIKVTA